MASDLKMGHRALRLPGAAAIKGRGAASRVPGRFERTVSEAQDDGWGSLHAPDEHDPAPPAPPATEVTQERARSIISRNDSPDVGFNQSVNPYRGCEHGMVAW